MTEKSGQEIEEHRECIKRALTSNWKGSQTLNIAYDRSIEDPSP
jgi:hypothetical protein